VNFDTRNVVKLNNMFYNAISFNQPVNFQANVQTAKGMFQGATSFNQSVTLNTTSLFKVATAMFAGVNACFNQPVSLSTTSGLTDVQSMFLNVSGFHQDLSRWSTPSAVSCLDFCSQCGLPIFTQCNPCGNSSSITLAPSNVTVCKQPVDASVCEFTGFQKKQKNTHKRKKLFSHIPRF